MSRRGESLRGGYSPFIGLLCGSLGVWLALPGTAAEPELRVVAPLGPYYRPGEWAALRVELNVPELPVQTARAGLAAGDDGAPDGIFRLPLEKLLPGERRSFDFLLLPGANPPRLTFFFSDAQDRRLYAQALPAGTLRPLEAGWRLAVSTGALWPVLPRAHYVTVDPAELPTTPAAYASLDLLVIGEPGGRPVELGPAAPAVAEWLVRGGTLIWLGDPEGRALRRAIAAEGWRLGPPAPFIAPPAERSALAAEANSALTLRLGLGRIVTWRGSPDRQILTGGQVWRNLTGFWRSPAQDDARLAEKEYQAWGDWPAPPRPTADTIRRWTLAGLLLWLAVWRLSPPRWRTAGALGGALALAAAFLLVHPGSSAARVWARLRLAAPAGAGTPALDRELTAQTAFADTAEIRLPFVGWPPPRPLARTAAELANWRLEVNLDAPQRGEVRLVSRRPMQPAARRGQVQIFDRPALGPVLDQLQAVCQAGPNGLRLQTAAPLPRLHDAWLLTRRGGIPCPAESAAGRRPEEPPALTDREQFRRRGLALNSPGDNALWGGWEEPEPAGDFLGTLRLYGLPLCPMSE